jgi:hypothetical protein
MPTSLINCWLEGPQAEISASISGRRALAGANPWRIFSKVVSKKLILDTK